MKCPKCFHEFEPPAKGEGVVCPSCGVVPEKFEQAQKAKLAAVKSGVHPRQVAREQNTPRAKRRAVTAGVLVAALVGLMIYSMTFGPTGTPSVQDGASCGTGKDAFVMSQLFVEDRLKAPATAKFPGTADRAVITRNVGECVYLVSAYVDSQNSYGAMIRSSYTARMQFDKASSNWRALEVTVF